MGIMAIEYMCKLWGIPLINDGKLQSLVGVAESEIEDGFKSSSKTIFLKPKGFMNLSGVPVSKAMKHYKVPLSRLVVIHDDLERKLCKVSLKNGGSANGHNGLRSIIQVLGRSDFTRIRVGIDRPDDRSQVSNYVLSTFTKQEYQVIETQVMPKVFDIVNGVLRH
jgi:peptidyl-tRNA hydrolase, PTH1 family